MHLVIFLQVVIFFSELRIRNCFGEALIRNVPNSYEANAMIHRYRISMHANEQIERRQIDISQIDHVLKLPDFIHIESDCVHVYQMVIHEGETTYLLRVFVNICKTPALVITAYKTSKLSKYENYIR